MISEAFCSNVIRVVNPSKRMRQWCYNELVINNPDYYKKLNMGKWTGNTPKEISLYETNGTELVLPFGVFRKFYLEFRGECRFKPEFGDLRHEKYISHINLYPYQQKAVNKALDIKNGIVVMPCGSGKTVSGLEIIAKLGGRALWLTHTQDLLNQSMRSAEKTLEFDGQHPIGTITAGAVDIGTHITFATVQTMCKVDVQRYKDYFDIVVVDECMPCDTMIDTPYGKKKLQSLKNGDIITSFNRNTGKIENKRITHLFKNKAHDIVKIALSNGESIICTKNHPIYVRGKEWLDAERLSENDYVLRLVWEGSRDRQFTIHNKIQNFKEGILLLLERLFNKRCKKKGYLDRGTKKKGVGNYVKNKRKISRAVCKAYDNEQSHEECRNKGKGFKAIKRNRTQTTDKMWKWRWFDSATTKIGNQISRLCGCLHGISNTNKNATRERLSNLLQSGYSNSRKNGGNRDRWQFSLCDRKTATGLEKRAIFEWIRVDSVEIQEQTSDGTFGGMCCDGYVYNIEVEDNNNYFADNYLVHNCHHACGSPTKVTQFYKVLMNINARYKIGLTATPKRADGLEIGMFALLGGIIHEVPREEVSEKTCPVKVEVVETGYTPNEDNILFPDGTINYSAVIDDLIDDEDRYNVVYDTLAKLPMNSPTIVLANRVRYLQKLCEEYNENQIGTGVCLSGGGQSKKAKQMRKNALEALNDGEIDCIFATYQLSKEGLDVPNLRYVVFATPEKDETTVVQSVGRVGRSACGKEYGTVIDFVDDFGMYKGWAKQRKRYYKKIKAEVLE